MPTYASQMSNDNWLYEMDVLVCGSVHGCSLLIDLSMCRVHCSNSAEYDCLDMLQLYTGLLLQVVLQPSHFRTYALYRLLVTIKG